MEQLQMLCLKEIDDLFSITYSSVSHIVKTIRKQILKDRDLKQKFTVINSLGAI